MKVFVDTAAVMEKPLAAAAGIGWQGKHTNLVSREFGSWLFLGAIFTTLELPADEAEPDSCGTCHACLDICPTAAFPAPYRLDARRCISYLTIEHKGPIPREFRAAIGNRIYGCDDCLAVCPWNKFAQQGREAKLAAREAVRAPALAELVQLDDAAFRKMFAKTAVKRTGRERFVRNVLTAIGNSGDPALAPHAERLLADPSPLIRGAAVWALGRLDPARLASLASAHAGEQGRQRRRGMGRRGRRVLGLPQQRSSSGGSTMAALTRRTMLAGLSAAAVLRPDRAFAAWPERNISLIHGLTAGGGVDVSARLIADGLSRKLGQQVVVEPKPGAGGTLASSQIARATPDGYTLCWIPSGYAVTAAMYKSLPYQPIDDFTIIGQAIDFPFVMVTYPDHPIRNIPDLIKVAKERKEPLLGGVPGAGTPQHLLLEYLSRLAGIKIQVVTFRGGNQALTELLGKRLDFLVDPPIALIGQVKSGGLHAIGTTGEKPLRAAARTSAPSPKRASPDFPSPRGWDWSAPPSCRRRSRPSSTPTSTR